MRAFATFDASGDLTGLYTDVVHGATTLDDGSANPDHIAYPAGSVEISADAYADLLANPGLRRWDTATSTVVAYAPPPPPASPRQQLGGVFLGAVADLGWWSLFDQGGAAQVAAGKPLDQRYWLSIGKADRVLATDAKLIRVAKAAEAARVAASGQAAPAAPVITITAVMDHGDAMSTAGS